MKLEINEKRIAENIQRCASFNDGASFNFDVSAGISRFTYGKADSEVKAWLCEKLAAMGIEMKTDAIGNVTAVYGGRDSSLAPVMIGSHLDSVRNGGRYDGVVGVMSALEVISVLHENGYVPKRPIELIVFAEEEGSNFGTTMVGSKVMVGKLGEADLEKLKTEDGRTCIDIAKAAGLKASGLESAVISGEDVYAMIEVHIEQSVVLEREGKRLGVVQTIAGMTTYSVTVTGVSNHAGGTPMKMRNDPMPAAAVLILDIDDIAKTKVNETTVATVGSISASPGMPNVIPREVTFTIDVRDITQEGIDTACSLIKEAARAVEEKCGVQIEFDEIGSSSPIQLSEKVKGVITKAVTSCTEDWMNINSGAVHDAAMIAGITDAGMIFVPSVDGKSHCPEEFTENEDIALGAKALLMAVIELAEA